MGTVKIETDIDVSQVVNAAGLSELMAAAVAAHGPADLAQELCDDEDFVHMLISELTPEQLVRAIMRDTQPLSLSSNYWLPRVRQLLNEACDTLAGEKPKDALPGETVFVAGGLEWRQVPNGTFDEARRRCPEGWRLPTLAETMNHGNRLRPHADRWVWVDEPLETNRIIMFGVARHGPVIGDPELIGSVVYVREAAAKPTNEAVSGRFRWRFAGNHTHADALKMEREGWHLPTLALWQAHAGALRTAALDPDIARREEYFAWVGGEEKQTGDSIVMWDVSGCDEVEGITTDEGATYLVRSA